MKKTEQIIVRRGSISTGKKILGPQYLPLCSNCFELLKKLLHRASLCNIVLGFLLLKLYLYRCYAPYLKVLLKWL